MSDDDRPRWRPIPGAPGFRMSSHGDVVDGDGREVLVRGGEFQVVGEDGGVHTRNLEHVYSALFGAEDPTFEMRTCPRYPRIGVTADGRAMHLGTGRWLEVVEGRVRTGTRTWAAVLDLVAATWGELHRG